MDGTLLEIGAEFGAVAIRTIGAVCAAAAGIVVEMNGVQTLGTGGQVVGVWMALLGFILLVIGYVLATDAIGRLRPAAH